MGIKSTLIVISATIFVILLFAYLLIMRIKNTNDCEQFVIDNIELSTGVDITEMTNCVCVYDSIGKIKRVVFDVDMNSVQTDRFIARNNFTPVASSQKESLEEMLHGGNNKFFHTEDITGLSLRAGESSICNWKMLMDKNVSRLYVFLQYKK